MSDGRPNQRPVPAETPTVRRLLGRNGWAIAAIAAATLVVELGTFALAMLGPGGADPAAVARGVSATLAVCAVWTALMAPVAAASARDAWGALLRGGTVIDASGVCLLGVWLLGRAEGGEPFVPLLAAAKIYCVLLAVGLTGIAGARVLRTPGGRYTAAAGTAVVLMVALAAPFWANGLLAALGPDRRGAAADVVMRINPLSSIDAALPVGARFTWHSPPAIYDYAVMGDMILPPPARWYRAVVVWALVAGMLAVTHLLRRPGRSRGPADSP